MEKSIAKQQDRRIRRMMLECAQVSLRNGLASEAKDVLGSAKQMQEKINTRDYTREDAWLAREKWLHSL